MTDIEGTITLDDLLLIQAAVTKATRERDELRVEVERRTRIMDDLAWAHAPCDCESHQRWLTFDRPKEC